jgi:hypothetical protein
MSGYLKIFFQWIRQNMLLTACLIMLHGLFFILACHYKNISISVDSKEYLHQADNLIDHQQWYAGEWSAPHDPFLESRRPPAYGFFIALVKIVYASDYFVLVIQNIFSVLTLLLSYFFYAKLAATRQRIHVLMLLPLLFFPTQFIYANMIMADVLFEFLIVIAFIFLYFFLKRGSTGFFAAYNFFIALAILTKPVLYLFSIVSIVFAIVLFAKQKRKTNQFVLSFFPLLCVLCIAMINFNKTGYFHYSSVNQKFVSEYGAYLALGEKGNVNAQFHIDSILSVAKSKADFKDYSTFLEQESLLLIKQNGVRFFLMQGKGMINFFLDHGRWDLMAFFVNPDYVQEKGWRYYLETNGIKGLQSYISSFSLPFLTYLALTIGFNIILLFCLIRFMLNRSILLTFRIHALLFIAYLVVFTSVVGCSRYRMAIYPFLLIAFCFELKNRIVKN